MLNLMILIKQEVVLDHFTYNWDTSTSVILIVFMYM